MSPTAIEKSPNTEQIVGIFIRYKAFVYCVLCMLIKIIICSKINGVRVTFIRTFYSPHFHFECGTKWKNKTKIEKHTFPTIGNSTDPHVSAAQCTSPEPKSAVIMPQNAAAITMPNRSTRRYRMIRNKFNIIKLMHRYTQINSCNRFPEK